MLNVAKKMFAGTFVILLCSIWILQNRFVKKVVQKLPQRLFFGLFFTFVLSWNSENFSIF